jgi:hypothetical protein
VIVTGTVIVSVASATYVPGDRLVWVHAVTPGLSTPIADGDALVRDEGSKAHAETDSSAASATSGMGSRPVTAFTSNGNQTSKG